MLSQCFSLSNVAFVLSNLYFAFPEVDVQQRKMGMQKRDSPMLGQRLLEGYATFSRALGLTAHIEV